MCGLEVRIFGNIFSDGKSLAIIAELNVVNDETCHLNNSCNIGSI